MRVNAQSQKLLFPEIGAQPLRDETASTFLDNMCLPVHRWFRFSAGFSAQWVEGVIAEAERRGRVNVLDPFAGAGTTLIAAERTGAACFGVEAHPVVGRIARAKLLYRTDPGAYLDRAREVETSKP
jgi:adenine-specific DNA methylase